MLHITYEMAKGWIADAIKDRGADYVYEWENNSGSCMYVHGNKPGCGVGYALHHGAGVPLLTLVLFEGQDADGILKGLTSRGISSDGDARMYLNYFQQRQDNGTPWGEADALARAAMGDHGDPAS